MASRSLGTLTLDLVAKIGGFARGMGQAERLTKQRLDAIRRHAREFGKQFGIAITAATAAAAYAIKSAVDRADEIYNAAKKIGVATETLSALEYAAKQAGVEFESLQSSLGKLAKYQVEAATGNKEAANTFRALGIEIKDANGNLRDVGDLLPDIARVFAQMEDGSAKTALAIRLFGKSGADLIPLLDEGAEGLKTMTDRAAELGAVIDSETAANADAFNDALDDLQTAVSGVAMAVAAELLPDLRNLTDSFVDNTVEGGKVAKTAREIAGGFRLARDMAYALWDGFGYLNDRSTQLLSKLHALFAMSPGGRALGLVTGINSDEVAVNMLRMSEAARRSAEENGADFMRAISGSLSSGGAGSVQNPGQGDQFDRNGRDVIFGGDGFGKGSGHSPKKEVSEAEQAAKRLQDAYESLLASQNESIALFGKEGEAAKVRYDIEYGELKGLSDAKKAELVQNAERMDQMREEAEVKKELDRIDKERKEGIKEYFDDLAFEESLLGKTNAQRAAEIDMRRLGIDLATKEGQILKEQAVARIEALEAGQQQIDFADSFRDHWEDAFADVLTGTKSIKEAFNDLAASILADIAKMLAHKWVESLFGQQGTPLGGGGGGGFLSSLFGSLFGGGSGGGGAVASGGGGLLDWILPGYGEGGRPPVGTPYWVGENGPELRVDDRPGTIVPAAASAMVASGGGFTQIVNQNYAAPYDPRTQQQAAAGAGFAARRAFARNRR